MTYKTKKNYKDLAEPCKGQGMSRRELMARGFATGFMSVALHDFLIGNIMNKAFAAGLTCPAPVRAKGAIGQIFAEGGPTMGARFISEAQAAMMNVNMAGNYGISGQANLQKIGPNLVVDKTSPFGFTLLQGPPGFPGGPAGWQANVLSKVSGGGHLGPFNQDDGAGQNTGLIGGVGPFKVSTMAKDLSIGVSNTVATWANGLPAAAVKQGGLAPTSFSSAFSLTPPAAGLTNSAALSAASDAANSLQSALSPVFSTASRKGASVLAQSAGCAFYGNSALADPNYGATLFNPANITDLAGKVTLAQLSNQEQALLAAYYQSAAGVAGGVITEFGGRDYHGQSPQNNIAPADIEEARAIVMFLAACDAAAAPGAFIYTSNGQAIANKTAAVTATINGATANLNAPVAQGDAGGSYNAGLMIFYSPVGAPVQAKFTGTVDQNGNAKTDPNVGSSQEAIAGLYLSALKFINNGTIPTKALAAMNAAGVAQNPSKITVL
jgi:hypothetical protein